MKTNGGYFTVELTIIIVLIMIIIITVLILLNNVTGKIGYSIESGEYERAFNNKIKEIRMQKIMREIR